MRKMCLMEQTRWNANNRTAHVAFFFQKVLSKTNSRKLYNVISANINFFQLNFFKITK